MKRPLVKTFSWCVPLLLLAVAVAVSASAAPPKGTLLEKTVDVPRATRVPVELSFEKATLLSVESQNDPQATDVQEARDKDPDDKTFILIRFHYRNDDYRKHKVSLRAILLDAEGGVLGESGRTATMDPKTTEDTLSFPMKVRTLDWESAAKMKVTATFLN